MECISSISCNLIVNGKQSSIICPTRGLRQQDPLSLYLFLFIVDILFRMVNKVVKSNRMSGIKLGRKCPSLSHLFFINDFLFFMSTNVRNVFVLKFIMERYCVCSGQTINLNKSCSTRTRGSGVRQSIHDITCTITCTSRKFHEMTFIETILLIFQ